MGPFKFYGTLNRMKDKASKFDLRLRVVQHAMAEGVKPTARLFATTPKTVRKWLNRYRQEPLAGLNELSRMPLRCPHKTPPAIEQRIVQLRRQFPFMGPKRLKLMHDLPASHEAIRRILKEHGLLTRRREKHQRKRGLRAGWAALRSAGRTCRLAGQPASPTLPVSARRAI